MQYMAITGEQAALLRRLLNDDDADNRRLDLQREEEFEELDGKLACVLRMEETGGWMLTDEEIASLPRFDDGIAPELRA